MFRIKNVTIKNFISIGNVTQSVKFDQNQLILVLGDNQDVTNGEGNSRNGVGKSALVNAVSYALYGNALTNIRKQNLINKTNSKGMLVTVDFEKNGIDYRIERGRGPNVLRFFIGEHEQTPDDDNSQGDSRATQQSINELLNMSHEMFKHIVALNTYTTPFLSLKSSDQREIIEQLMGITQLSEKAETLKEQIKDTRSLKTEEEYQIKSIRESNARFDKQIASLKLKQRAWQRSHEEETQQLTARLHQLSKVDIENEIETHNANKTAIQALRERDTLLESIKRIKRDVAKHERDLERYNNELSNIVDHTCHSCGQTLHDTKQQELETAKKELIEEASAAIQVLTDEETQIQHLLTEYQSIKQSDTVYDSVEEAYDHKTTMNTLSDQLERSARAEDPYTEQIEEMLTHSIQEVDYDAINSLQRVLDHQEFLYKLLTSKDSFIRKRIIDQNLSFLNSRLLHYLSHLGLPHEVEFQNDLTVQIQDLGRELDFDNLSRGERNRLILSMSWAFRDVWENLFQPINVMFVDEMIDSGLDSNGVESAVSILKRMSRERDKNIWLISHRDELSSRVNNILWVIKSGGFTEFSTDTEIEEA